MNLQLRDYQDRIVGKTLAFFEEGGTSLLIESPTGSGKTIMALAVLEHFENRHGWRINWVAMRRNLLRQVRKTNDQFFGLRNLMPVSMFDRDPPPAEITVVDEAQHDAAASCIHIHAVSRSRIIFGLTATPYRTDRLKLAFQRVVRDAGIHRLIQDGWLCPYHHWSISEWTPTTVAATYLRDSARWGKTVVFFRTVDQCHEFATILDASGHRCAVITADTDREAQLGAFDAGAFPVVANVAILNEGFDCPDLRTVFVRDAARLPTIQMAGRALRIHDGKPFCNIVQSRNALWPFPRTAAPARGYVLSGNQWLCLRNSEAVDRVSKQTAAVIARRNVVLPECLLSKKARRARSSESPGRTPTFLEDDPDSP
jgi:superfamily II DNA or RNA helicase